MTHQALTRDGEANHTPVASRSEPGLLVRVGSRAARAAFTALAALTILPSGCNLALPGDSAGVPWAAAYEIVHGVFVHNVLAMFWFGVTVVLAATVGLRTRIPSRARLFATLVALFGVVGLASTAANALRFSTWADVGEGGRFFLSAFYFLLLCHWAYKKGPGFVMRWYLAGIAAGGLINLYVSVAHPSNRVGVLPFLTNRNGAGGILALGIVLCAWTWRIRGRISRLDRAVSVAVSLVGLTAVAMSYSKTSMIIGAVGIITWIAVLNVTVLKVVANRYALAVVIISAAMAYTIPLTALSNVMGSVYLSVQAKFTSALSPNSRSVSDRLNYYVAAAEIFRNNPIVGVGYSGFYQSEVATSAYKEGLVDEEDPQAGKRSNPHNSYLYYLIANGTLGLILMVCLSALFFRAIFLSIQAPRHVALLITGSIALAYVLYASALPSLFKTEAMYVPAAAAMAARVGRGWRR